MLRKLVPLVLALFVCASAASAARTRSVSHPERRVDGATISGTISSIDGTIVRVADGTIAIEAGSARIITGRGNDATLSDLAPGMLLVASIRPETAENGVVIANVITAVHLPDAAILGAVQSTDVNGSTLTVAGQTVHVDEETSFGGVHRDGTLTLADLLPGALVSVQADAVDGRLVARSVLVAAPLMPEIRTLRGNVQSIGTDAWVVGETTFVIDAQTRIAGSPKVGDRVEVLYRVDSSHANVAMMIVRVPEVELPSLTRISGIAKSIGSAEWVVSNEERVDVTIAIGERTMIQPGIRVGDRIDVLAARGEDGKLKAVMITRRPPGM